MRFASVLSAILLFLLTILLSTCQQASQNYEEASIIGIWESIGYGKVLDIKTEQFQVYDITDFSCLPALEGKTEEIRDLITLNQDSLIFQMGYNKYEFVRASKMPSVCDMESTTDNDPVHNFEVFANTIEDHYAYFDLNQINWEEFYAGYKEGISSNTSEAELYLILEEMLDSLNDNHGYIEPSDEVYEKAEALSSTDEDETGEGLKEYGDLEVAPIAAAPFLEEDLTKDSRFIRWGKLEDSIGYIQVNTMFLYAELDLSDELLEEEGLVGAYFTELNKLPVERQLSAEIEGVANIMDRVMTDLGQSKFIILDVRFNGGGNDHVGLEVLHRFNPRKIQVASKKARHENGYTREIPILLDAAENAFTRPVYLLTSQQSASATDMMALSSMALGHIQRIGSHTEGAISDALEKTLPNGWYYSISNEVYLDLKGNVYESKGIPVDYELNYNPDRQSFFRRMAEQAEKEKERVMEAIAFISDTK